MPQSLADINVHYIFSTKNREPLIKPDWRPRLHEYIGGMARQRKCRLLAAGGVADHIHLLVSIHRETASSDLMREFKGESTKWIRSTIHDAATFTWQSGYGAFSVSHSGIGAVAQYIANQETHHAAVSFQDEYRAFLRKHGLEWDERYVWD